MLVRNQEDGEALTSGDQAFLEMSLTLRTLTEEATRHPPNTPQWFIAVASIMDLIEAMDYVAERNISKTRLRLQRELGHYTEFKKLS